jgi:hypothetical protein
MLLQDLQRVSLRTAFVRKTFSALHAGHFTRMTHRLSCLNLSPSRIHTLQGPSITVVRSRPVWSTFPLGGLSGSSAMGWVKTVQIHGST